MKRPWAGKTGVAKATAIVSAVFLVSLGLCGVTVVAASVAGRSDFTRFDWVGGVFAYCGIVEYHVILIAGVIWAGLILFQSTKRRD